MEVERVLAEKLLRGDVLHHVVGTVDPVHSLSAADDPWFV